MKFSLNLQPLCLDNEFNHTSTHLPDTTPVHTPTSSPLSSPPRIERLRLFDTPCTPRSLIRKSSNYESTCSTPAGLHQINMTSLLSSVPAQHNIRYSTVHVP